LGSPCGACATDCSGGRRASVDGGGDAVDRPVAELLVAATDAIITCVIDESALPGMQSAYQGLPAALSSPQCPGATPMVGVLALAALIGALVEGIMLMRKPGGGARLGDAGRPAVGARPSLGRACWL